VTALRQPVPAPTAVRAVGPSDSVAAGMVLGGVGLGALLVLALWVQDATTVLGASGWLTGAGRITGLLAGYAVVVQLALMARVPWLEHHIGTDRLARWHASGGRYTVCLAVAHTLLIIWGYALAAHTGVIGETGTLLTSYPDVLMATVGLGLFVLIGVVSARAARRKMSYEAWHFVHLYTYLAIALAFAHQFATGVDFTDRRVRVLWAAFYVVVAGLLVWYRVCVPLQAAFRHRLRVTRVVRENPNVVSIYVTGHRLDELGAVAGQFFRWRFLTRELWWAANPYSLSAAPSHGQLRITVKITGEHSAALLRLRPGTPVFAEGPYGSFTAARRRRRHVVLIGAGIGITPLRALFEALPGGPGELTMVYRESHANDLVLRHEIDEIAATRGARVHYVVGRRHRNRNDPLSAHNLVRMLPWLREADVFLCGPDELLTTLRPGLRKLGVPGRQIHSESFVF
jgi:predicted ferric reductase